MRTQYFDSEGTSGIYTQLVYCGYRIRIVFETKFCCFIFHQSSSPPRGPVTAISILGHMNSVSPLRLAHHHTAAVVPEIQCKTKPTSITVPEIQCNAEPTRITVPEIPCNAEPTSITVPEILCNAEPTSITAAKSS